MEAVGALGIIRGAIALTAVPAALLQQAAWGALEGRAGELVALLVALGLPCVWFVWAVTRWRRQWAVATVRRDELLEEGVLYLGRLAAATEERAEQHGVRAFLRGEQQFLPRGGPPPVAGKAGPYRRRGGGPGGAKAKAKPKAKPLPLPAPAPAAVPPWPNPPPWPVVPPFVPPAPNAGG